jgi:hypothetical protein
MVGGDNRWVCTACRRPCLRAVPFSGPAINHAARGIPSRCAHASRSGLLGGLTDICRLPFVRHIQVPGSLISPCLTFHHHRHHRHHDRHHVGRRPRASGVTVLSDILTEDTKTSYSLRFRCGTRLCPAITRKRLSFACFHNT